MGMKTFSIITFILFSYLSNSQGIQHKNEFGGGIGAMHYSGDLSPSLRVQDFSPSVQVFYRNNYANNYSVLRFNMLVGQIKASEKNQGHPLPEYRDLSFSAMITEFSIIYEYNFLNYREISRGTNEDNFLSPYVFGGIGASIMVGNNSPTYLVLPIGAGLKFQLSSHLNLGFEVGVRKTFSDNLDGYSDDVALNSSSKFDSHYHTGFTLSYTIYSDMCADHYKNW